VLAAGNGDRFHNGTRRSKLLQPLMGQPLILRTIDTIRAAGLSSICVVLGYQAEALREAIVRGAPEGVEIRFAMNPDWHLENGVSVLAARPFLDGRRFALLMGDHLFEAPVLTRLASLRTAPDASLLAVDARPAAPEVAAEATKVRLDGTRITAIGKDVVPFDALDTGLFVCAPALFDALEASRAGGDTTLSGGIRQLAARGLMHAVDIGGAGWHDIDTMADLAAAEDLLAEHA
jgi:1L-myo-inositol 1-phosphate cytidylyltransferase